MCGLYGRYVFPWLMDWLLRGEKFAEQRKKVLADAAGVVVEIGFGTGLNLAHYGPHVVRLFAVEPVAMLPGRVRQRIGACPIPVERVEARAESLPLTSGSCDCAVTTWTLCSVGDVAASLAELKRVLRPGGKLIFLEHGLSDNPSVAKWQRRLTPIQRVLGCGCRLDRPIGSFVEQSGLSVERMDRFVLEHESPIFATMYAGVARKADTAHRY
jgi:ubiquinone/menaquinone biosynthesis C-methylase UbiE